MKKRFALVALVACVAVVSASAIDVDKVEVSSTQGTTIEFINYEGPHDIIETADAIRGIGSALGASISGGATRAGDAVRYQVIHAVDPTAPTGFDADILILGPDSRVDHIKNLRRIIAGYLEAAYAYSTQDADTLAVFITIYNAVYRGKLDYFQGKYKQVVLRELSAANAGLAIRWDEWAGKSRIVIPLTSRAGTGVVGSINTTPITDKPTIESLKAGSPTAGVTERRDVVDIKERDQEQEKAAIADERDRIAREEAAVSAEKARLESQQAAQQAAQPETAAVAGDSGQAGGAAQAVTTPGTGEQAAKGADQQASIAVSDKAKAEEAAVAARAAQVEADKAAVAGREAAVAAKDAEIAADRKAIAADQKDAIKEQVAAAAQQEANGVPLFELVDPNAPLSRIALVDLASGKTIRRSTINTIRAATIVDVGDAYVAVAGQITGTGGAVRLVRVLKSDYANVTQGADDVFGDTMLWKYGTSIYAVTKLGPDWVMGRFDPATLQIKARSAPVSRWTFLTEAAGKLVAQGPSGSFLVLDSDALTTASEIKR
jgi:hypothetical protein